MSTSTTDSILTPVVAATGVDKKHTLKPQVLKRQQASQHPFVQSLALKKMHLYFLEELSKIEDTSKLTGQLAQFIKSYNFNIDSKTPVKLLKALASNELLSMTKKRGQPKQ